jgi:ribosomal RNA-processing protein 8
MKNNPQQWIEYHQNLEEATSQWGINPCDEIIKRLKHFPSYSRIGDFGCGKAKVLEVFGERVFSCDYVAINSKVKSCDMKSADLPDRCLDIIVLCLSLMNKNWPDHIIEAKTANVP